MSWVPGAAVSPKTNFHDVCPGNAGLGSISTYTGIRTRNMASSGTYISVDIRSVIGIVSAMLPTDFFI